MPTHHEVLTTDLSGLTAAAGRWEEMATRFKTLENRYERDVHGISLGESWIGLSAQAANDKVHHHPEGAPGGTEGGESRRRRPA